MADDIPAYKNLLRSIIDAGLGGAAVPFDGSATDTRLISQENLQFNLLKLSHAVDQGRIVWGRPDDDKLFRFVRHFFDDHHEVPTLVVVKDHFQAIDDLDVTRRLEVVETATPYARTNFHHLLERLAVEKTQLSGGALFREAVHLLGKGTDFQKVYDLVVARGQSILRTAAPGDQGPAPGVPLRGCPLIMANAIWGEKQYLALAEGGMDYIWENIVERGDTVVVGARVGSGKTSLICWAIIARAQPHDSVPLLVLGQPMYPAPENMGVFVIEAEHSDKSISRLYKKTCHRLKVPTSCLDRVMTVARTNFTIGSPMWRELVSMIRAGLISDIVIDTLARVGIGDANSEEDQVGVFNALDAAIKAAPSQLTRPTIWVAAHVKKGGAADELPTLEDISGSSQRAGAANVVITCAAHRDHAGNVEWVNVGFPKRREKDADDRLDPVKFQQTKDAYKLLDVSAAPPKSLPERIADLLATAGALTQNQLSTRLGRSSDAIGTAITELFNESRLLSETKKADDGKNRKHFKLRPGYRSNGVQEGVNLQGIDLEAVG